MVSRDPSRTSDAPAAGPLGLIAGGGRLPNEALTRLRARGEKVEIFGFEGVTEPGLVSQALMTRLGQLERLLGLFRARGVERLLIVGKFEPRLLQGEGAPLEADRAAQALIASRAGAGDVALMSLLAGWLEAQGYLLCRQDRLLEEMLAGEGRLARRGLDAGERRDLDVGRRAVAGLSASATAAQAVAVSRGTVVAWEDAAGTDAMIRRAAGHGATIVKGARPGQDRRLDLPTVGPATIESMIESGARALAVEAFSTLVVGGPAMRAAADAAQIGLWGFRDRSERS
jgi:hypothetical protein